MINRTQNTARQALLPPFPGFDVIQGPNIQNRPIPRRRMQQSFIKDILTSINNQQRQIQENFKRHQKLLSYFNDQSFTTPKQHLTVWQYYTSKIDQKIKCISPESKLLLIWNMIILISIAYQFIEIPISACVYHVAYKHFSDNPVLYIIDVIIQICLTIDFIIRPNIGIYQNGRYIYKRSQLYVNYLKFHLWLDLFCWLILLFFLADNTLNASYTRIVFYFKIFALVQLDRAIQSRLQLMTIRYSIYRLLRIVAFVFFFVNWCACIYFAIDYAFYQQQEYYYQTTQLWLNGSSATSNLDLVQIFPWTAWYNYALYWAVQTSSTIGYGDMTPRNPVQVAFCNFTILLMTVIFAFFINSIWDVINQLEKSSQKYAQNWRNLKAFLNGVQLPYQLQRKLGLYFHQLWQQSQEDQNAYKTITDMLSKQLKDELLVSSRQFIFDMPILTQLKVFSLQDWSQMARNLSAKVIEKKFAQEEKIYTIMDCFGKNDNYLYYLIKGNVKLVLKNSWMLQQVKSGQHFGIQQFFLDVPREHQAIAQIYSKIAFIKYADFIKQIRNSNLSQKFCQQRENIIIYSQVWLVNYTCWQCKSNRHFVKNCPRLHLWKQELEQQYVQMKDYQNIHSFIRSSLKIKRQTEINAIGDNNRRVKKNRAYKTTKKVIDKYLTSQIQIDQIMITKYYRADYNII